jgi:hypothetical protein
MCSEDKSDLKKSDLLTDLEKSIVANWNFKIAELLNENPFTEEELAPFDDEYKAKLKDATVDYRYKTYGATLIVAVVCEDFWFGFHIGDGTFAVKQNGEWKQPIELDPKCVGVNVTSICDSNAIKYFHHAWGYGVPDAIFVASDGVDESFASVEWLYKFYDNIIENNKEDWDSTVEELKEYLPELSAEGSQDDVSLAAIINLDRIQIDKDVSSDDTMIDKDISSDETIPDNTTDKGIIDENMTQEKVADEMFTGENTISEDIADKNEIDNATTAITKSEIE